MRLSVQGGVALGEGIEYFEGLYGIKILTQAQTAEGQQCEGAFINVTNLAALFGVVRKTIYNRLARGALAYPEYTTLRGGPAWTLVEALKLEVSQGQPVLKNTARLPGRTYDVVVGDGETRSVRLFGVGDIAQALGVRAPYWRSLEIKDRAPQTPLWVRRGHRLIRLYTFEMIAGAVQVLKALESGGGEGLDHPDFHETLSARWRALGVYTWRVTP